MIDLALVLPGMLVTGCRLYQRHRVGRFWTEFWLALSVFTGSSIVATLVLILGSGDTETIPPLVMVSVIVVLAASGCTERLIDLGYT